MKFYLISRKRTTFSVIPKKFTIEIRICFLSLILNMVP